MAFMAQSVAASAVARTTSMPVRLSNTHFITASKSSAPLPMQCLRSVSTQLYPRRQPHQRTSCFRPGSPIHQCRSFLVKLSRDSQALKEPSTISSTSPRVTDPISRATVSAKGQPLQLTNLPYFVRRTASNQLPVYLVTKAGGTKQETKIQKTEGDLEALRTDLARALGLESAEPRAKKSSDVTINRLNGHIIVKGWRKPEITKFLLERNF